MIMKNEPQEDVPPPVPERRRVYDWSIFPFIKFIGLAALMLAACSTGNGFIIVAAVAALLFLTVGDNSDNLLISKLMFAGAGLGLFICWSAFHLAEAIRHQGFGIEVLRDSDSGFFLILVGVGIWFFVADYAKGINKLEKEKNELEKSWVRIILNPNNVQDIQRHPEAYRDDFKQWIEEIQPDLLLPAKNETQHKPVPTGMNTPPNQADEPINQRAMIGGVWVTEEAYEFHQREISKLVKERDDAAGAKDAYKYLGIGLAAIIILAVFLNSCVSNHAN
jgi:hypothetical protein